MKRLRSWRVAAALAATTLVVGSAGSIGCGTQCDRNPDQPPVVYKGGITNRAAGTYLTSGADGPFLSFPPGRTYRLYHGLGRVPDPPQTWLSFAEHPLDGTDPEGFVEAAGTQVTYEAITKDYVDVRNDTCSDVRILVKITAPPLDTNSGTDASVPFTATPDSGPL